MIPHPSIPVGQIRPSDIMILLGLGTVYEIISRTLAHVGKSKSSSMVTLELELKELQYETARKRRLGQAAFVETSKLERQVLAKEKELEKQQELFQTRTDKVARMVKYSGLAVYLLVFCVYYGIPMLTIDGMRVDREDLDGEDALNSDDRAVAFLNTIMFPISYVGFGVKISRLGIPNARGSIGALAVLWSSQVTVGKFIDCIEVLL
mmetsp:Transcript_6160/g.8727  ORF Transcript_6160/g.8727 Transcript_6160/m.8727 type:complete len:207 (+) Transcript_6160:165-785(+)